MKTALSIVILGLLIGGAIFLSSSGTTQTSTPSIHNVSVTSGKQVVEIGVKGGYTPQLTTAQANMPTVLRMKTNATFDCSASLSIPGIGYRNFLPSSGLTDIEVPAQKPGTVLRGVCAMGMYHFAVQFN
jgi:plastocyanin domain-containing protein